MKSILEENFLADTNILVYYLDKNSGNNQTVTIFFDFCKENKLTISLAQQNILELTSVLIKKYKIKKKTVVDMVEDFLSSNLFRIVEPLPTTVFNFLKFLDKLERPDIFDTFLAATALDNRINIVLTNNPKDFKKIQGLNVLSLKDLEKLANRH